MWKHRKKWSTEQEIDWTENYIRQLRHEVIYQQSRLEMLKESLAWWDRFIRFCRTGK